MVVSTRSEQRHCFPYLSNFFSYPKFRPQAEEKLISGLKGKDLEFKFVDVDEQTSERFYFKGRDAEMFSDLVKFKNYLIELILETDYPVISSNREDLEDVLALKNILKKDLEDLVLLRKKFFDHFLQKEKQNSSSFPNIFRYFVPEIGNISKFIELDWSYLERHKENVVFRDINFWSVIFSKNPYSYFRLFEHEDHPNWAYILDNPGFDFSILETHPEWLDSRKKCYYLSKNPNFDFSLLEKYPQCLDRWDWYDLSSNPNLDFSFVEKHPEWLDRWDWVRLSRNKNFDFSILKRCPEWVYRVYPRYLSLNENFDFSLLEEFPQWLDQWNWKFLSSNKNLDFSLLERHPEWLDRWSFKDLSDNMNFDFSLLERHPEWLDRWDWTNFSKNPNLDFSLLERHPEWLNRWEFRYLSWNRSFDFSLLERHPEWLDRWKWELLSGNPNFDFSLLERHPEWSDQWSFINLSDNPNFDFSLLERHPEWLDRWNWELLSGNPNFDFSLLERHPEWLERWDWGDLSWNANLNFSLVNKHPEYKWVKHITRENKIKRQSIYETYLEAENCDFKYYYLMRHKLFGEQIKQQLGKLEKIEKKLLERKAYQEETEKLSLLDTLDDNPDSLTDVDDQILQLLNLDLPQEPNSLRIKLLENNRELGLRLPLELLSRLVKHK